MVVVGLLSGSALAGPKLDELLCKRTYDRYGDKKVVLGIHAKDVPAATSPDGARSLKNAPEGKNGFQIVDAKTKKTVSAHNRDRSYDCDSALTDDGQANSVRWLGNDVVFAQGWYCEEFDAKPYLVNAKTGKFIGYVKVPVSPEADYLFAPLEGSRWAAAVFEHNSGWNAVVVIDTKSGKLKSTKKATAELIAKLPDCVAK